MCFVNAETVIKLKLGFMGISYGYFAACAFLQVRYYGPGGPGAAEGLREGDVLLSNHPQLAGGSHLPDITAITPVFRWAH